MAKILISWIATSNDFMEGKPNPDGPTASIHKLFYRYDYHLLLSAKKDEGHDTAATFLFAYLKRIFQHDIRIEYLNITDVIDVREIKAKVEKLLLQHRRGEIEIFISPGTPAMQVAWYLACYESGMNVKLFQTRPAKYSKSKTIEKIYIELEQSTVTSSLIIREELAGHSHPDNLLITKSIEPVFSLARKIAATDNVTALILGETGTGKEGLARFIHASSSRSSKPFVAINCSAINDSLLESRLFGYAKGAFTDAKENRDGYFVQADDGTIFLDEIGDISPYMQQSLLRVLQEKEVVRVGETKGKKIDVRIIAATNKNLWQLCEQGNFRFDLYYRLAVVELVLPPLRDRGFTEMEALFDFFLKKKKTEFNKPLPVLTSALKKRILFHSFPGNIRELENLVERIYAVSEVKDNKTIVQDNLQLKEDQATSLKLKNVETAHIKKVFALCNGNGREACRVLGISYNTLKAKISVKLKK